MIYSLTGTLTFIFHQSTDCLPVQKFPVGEVRRASVRPAARAAVERSGSRRRPLSSLKSTGRDSGGGGLSLVSTHSSGDQTDGVSHQRGRAQLAATGGHRYQSDRIVRHAVDAAAGCRANATHHVLGDEPRVARHKPVVLNGHLKDGPCQRRAAVKPYMRHISQMRRPVPRRVQGQTASHGRHLNLFCSMVCCFLVFFFRFLARCGFLSLFSAVRTFI